MSSYWVSCACVLVVVCLQLGSGIELETQSVYYGMVRTAANTENHSVCTQELTQIYKGIDTNQRWAIKLLDASGAPGTGLYWGNTYWPGSRQQCLAATSSKRVPVSRTSGPFTVETPHSLPPFPVHFYGAYFTHNSTFPTFVHWNRETRILLGLCLPSSCTETEIYGFLEEYFDSGILAFQKLYEASLTMEGVKKTEDDYAWTKVTLFKIFIVGVATTLTLCIVGTIYDVTIYKPMVEESKKNILVKESDCKNNTGQNSSVASKNTPKISFASNFIRCFSVDMNARSLFNTSASGDNTFRPLYGIRCLTILWIVVNHGLVYTGDAVSNATFVFHMSDYLPAQIFTSAALTVDTFISISGFLMGYIFLETEKKRAKTGVKDSLIKNMSFICLATLHRVARLLPAYLFTLGFAYTTSAMGHRQTVFWAEERNDITCPINWWRNLLFINNLFPKAEMCMSWSWYLGSDMQCFLLGLVLLTLATKYLKLVIFTFTSIFVVAHVYMGYLTYSTGYIPFLDNAWAHFDMLYSPTWTRFGPYIIGIAGGCFLQYFNRKLPINQPDIPNPNSDQQNTRVLDLQLGYRHLRAKHHLLLWDEEGIPLETQLQPSLDTGLEDAMLHAWESCKEMTSAEVVETKRRKRRWSTYFVTVMPYPGKYYLLWDSPILMTYPILSRLVGVTFCWVAGVGLGTGIIFGFVDKDMNLLSSALYMALGKSVWALSVVWLMVACLSGNGGFINTVLSHSFWIPLGKASYCVYLINPIIIKVIISYTDSAWEFAISTGILNGLGYVMLSFIFAFAFSILFEAPFCQLTKLLLGDAKPKTRERKLSENTLNNSVADKKEI